MKKRTGKSRVSSGGNRINKENRGKTTMSKTNHRRQRNRPHLSHRQVSSKYSKIQLKTVPPSNKSLIGRQSMPNLLKGFSLNTWWQTTQKPDQQDKNINIAKPAAQPSREVEKLGSQLNSNHRSIGRAVERWYNNPRITGAVAALLLFVTLLGAIIPSTLNVRAKEQAEMAALDPTMQLAKEFIYAGSRMLAIEDYGITPSATITPTPTPPTPTPTPDTPTPTPTPTPAPAVPSIASVTPNADPTCLDITLNGVSGADSYNVKILNSGYTINVTSLSFPWCGLAPSTYYEYQAQAVNQYGVSDWSGIVGGTTANPPPPATNNSSPMGNFDGIDGNLVVTGWSYDPDDPNNSNEVHVYIGGTAGGGGTGYAVMANQSRPDVNNAFGIGGNHGFSFQIPAQFNTGQWTPVYVYGIDRGTNSPTLLQGSPQYFGTPPDPTPTPCQSNEQDIYTCEAVFGRIWNYETCTCGW